MLATALVRSIDVYRALQIHYTGCLRKPVGRRDATTGLRGLQLRSIQLPSYSTRYAKAERAALREPMLIC
jgi:hypothetical protein